MYEAALALTTLIYLFVVGWYLRSPAFSLFHPLTFFCAFHGLVFVVRPWFAWYGQYDFLYYAFQFQPTLADKVTALGAATLGLVVFAWSSLRAGGMAMVFRQDAATAEQRRQLLPLFVWVIAICGPIGVYSLLTQFSNGLEGMVMDRATGISINTTGNGYLVDAQLMLVSLSAMAAWIYRFRLVSLLPLATFVLYRAGTGGRGPFIAAVASAGMFYLYERRRRFPGLRLALVLLPVLLLFRVVGDDRGAAIKNALTPGPEQVSAGKVQEPARPLESMDYANLEFLEYLVYVVPQRSGTYDYFLDNLQVLTEPVPRVLWPGKPIGAPIKRVDLLQYGTPIGMTLSVAGEGWYALGWLGVAIWSALFGLMTGTLYRKFVEGPQSAFQTSAYMVFMPSLIVGFRDGSLLSLIRSTGIYMIPILLWFALSRAFGMASIVQLRQALAERARRVRREPGSAAQKPTAVSVEPALLQLPPAVRRRRLALRMREAE